MWIRKVEQAFNGKDELVDTDSILHTRDGVLGEGCEIGDAHIIRQHHNYNGSGKGAFGGSESWAVVSAKIAFRTGEEERAAKFVEKLKALVDEEFADE